MYRVETLVNDVVESIRDKKPLVKGVCYGDQ